MEDTHWVHKLKFILWQVWVLILVLMEDTHWVSLSLDKPVRGYGLNPCFNGRYSLSAFIIAIDIHIVVLILVLMEDTHWED